MRFSENMLLLIGHHYGGLRNLYLNADLKYDSGPLLIDPNGTTACNIGQCLPNHVALRFLKGSKASNVAAQ